MKRIIVSPAVIRTTAGLRDFLFDQLDAFNAGKVTVDRARATCAVVGTILETAKVDLEYARFQQQNSTNKSKEVCPLKLGSVKEEKRAAPHR